MARERLTMQEKAESLGKAGFHPVTTVLIVILSSPGIWSGLFDDTDDEALDAVRAAYPALKEDIEEFRESARVQAEINLKLLSEINAMRMYLTMGRVDGRTMHPVPSQPVVDVPVLGTNVQLPDDGSELDSLIMEQKKAVPRQDELPNLDDLIARLREKRE